MTDIRQLREALGLTRAEFAARLGTTERTIYRWEAGETEPQGHLMRRAIQRLAAEMEANDG